MAYGDESLCEKSNCDGKESNIEENQKKKQKTNNNFNIFRVSTPT